MSKNQLFYELKQEIQAAHDNFQENKTLKAFEHLDHAFNSVKNNKDSTVTDLITSGIKLIKITYNASKLRNTKACLSIINLLALISDQEEN